jgi:hypothetical protein
MTIPGNEKGCQAYLGLREFLISAKHMVGCLKCAQKKELSCQVLSNIPSLREFLYLAFFTGATGLIYQVIWSRLLILSFGYTIYSVSDDRSHQDFPLIRHN